MQVISSIMHLSFLDNVNVPLNFSRDQFLTEAKEALKNVDLMTVDKRFPVKTFLKEAELEQIESCVRQAERTTRGEIVVMVAPGSHHYPVADLRGAAAFAIPAAVVLARTVGPLVWAGPHDLWIFLGIFLCYYTKMQ